ncbi:hypothetical protein GCM10010347_66560 [Streptomyces cirratus]|uniref:Uncharacterized protein n=1 Tax=Streptomyces cirratus TaxID=68187 RepID=A0ABQ3F5W0_9ACTN|nr:hypothetical protein GCM10010347_66560 [Streptomyces cirratus]
MTNPGAPKTVREPRDTRTVEKAEPGGTCLPYGRVPTGRPLLPAGETADAPCHGGPFGAKAIFGGEDAAEADAYRGVPGTPVGRAMRRPSCHPAPRRLRRRWERGDSRPRPG